MIVATDGQAVMRSYDDGKNWYRIGIRQDLEYDDRVRCLLVDPHNPEAVFAGAEKGLFYSDDCGAHWRRIDCALNGFAVWKLVASESDPNVIYAGTGAPSLAICFRSRDGGKNWEQTSLAMPEFCAGVNRPRMLALAVDPDDANDVWAGVEEGGLHRSRDGGETWARIDTSWPQFGGNSDIHDIMVLKQDDGTKVILALTVIALYRSTDDGQTWTQMPAKETWGLRYSRLLLRKPGSSTEVAVGIGDGTPGTTAAILTSSDAGATWTKATLDTPSNSCMWAFGANPADPDFLLSASKFGYLYRSVDGGRNWTKEWREFNEITDLTWLNAVPADQGLPHVTN
ncbi:MAG: glycosyl hydrolase [Alphaproteobacteria bacterium]|nr:glycosyl hydrolase [Alphaproteobacteria bacterium]MBU0794983.1 glycosyl hydrolase [Alphaproteobacteria bacterium]MBU0876641.1 glycosyl hydrolase [Alphaproteobacteria bacterium]MBU1769343.1 glycosyl hydrolase [Alphaproteobacteria bacterium]